MSDGSGRADASVTIHGKWWLPEYEEHKLHGTFTWSMTDGGTLEVAGELIPTVWKDNVLPDGSVQQYRDSRPTPGSRYDAIHGSRGSHAYTLLDASVLSVPYYPGTDQTYERVSVGSFLDGALFRDELHLSADRLIVDLRHLTTWIGHSGLSVEHPLYDTPKGDEDDRFAVITARKLPAVTSTAPNGLELRLVQNLQDAGDHLYDIGVAQAWRAEVRAQSPVGDDELIAVASDLRDIVSIATNATSVFDRVLIQHPALPKRSLAGTPIGTWREDIGYHARWLPRADRDETVSTNDLHFTFEDFGGAEGLGRWLTIAATYRTEVDRIMATRYSESMYLEDKVMNLAATVESLDRMRPGAAGGRQNYIDRVIRSVEYAGSNFTRLLGGESTESWSKRVKEVRHDLAHHRDRYRRGEFLGTHVMAKQLYWLAVICLLRLSQAPDAVYESLRRDLHLRHIVEQAEARL